MASISIEFNREMIDVSTRGHHAPDPKWTIVDSHGHTHGFDGNDLPTLEWIVTNTYWCETCRDEHEEGEWRCRLCGDVIEPHYNFTGPQRQQIPGLLDITLRIDGEPYLITPSEAEALKGLEGEALVRAATRIATQRER